MEVRKFGVWGKDVYDCCEIVSRLAGEMTDGFRVCGAGNAS